ncbi:MAG: FHA domain-containing protein [Oscillochloridaceae bacterium umkhey_bin13]
MFDLANISLGVLMLLLRVAVVFLLYFFLWQVLRVVARDLASGGQPPLSQPTPYGRLVVVSAGQTGIPVGKIFPLSPITVIGRSTDAEVSLNDSFLSAEHARLSLRNGLWALEDLGSTNGTFLNGFEVRAATEVHDGDLVRVGRVELKLVERS